LNYRERTISTAWREALNATSTTSFAYRACFSGESPGS